MNRKANSAGADRANRLFSLKQLYLLSLLLTCLTDSGVGQCIISSGGYTEIGITRTDYNWISNWASCDGPSCPTGTFIYLAEGRGSPCTAHEPSDVTMNTSPWPWPNGNQGIQYSYTITGQRSGWLFRYGGGTQPCNSIGTIFDEYVLDCLPCDMFVPLTCEDKPGMYSTYASCSIGPVCTASCLNPSPVVSIYAYDNCIYKSGADHWVEAWAYSTSGGVNYAGAYAQAAVYYIAFPNCTGFETSLCNGYHAVDVGPCGCPEDPDQY